MRDGVVVDLRLDETLTLSVDETRFVDMPTPSGVERVAITLEHKSGKVARLRIVAAEIVKIGRPKTMSPYAALAEN